MSAAPRPLKVETVRAHGCTLTLRHFEGPHAVEVFLHAAPGPGDAAAQAEALYRSVLGALDAHGCDLGAVVSESVFLRTAAEADAIRSARARVIAGQAAASSRRVTSEIVQPPLEPRAHLELSVHAVVSNVSPVESQTIAFDSTCECAECALAHGLRVQVGDEVRLYAGGLCGVGETAEAQTQSMFADAERLLERAGMGFGDVVRTWIHLRDIGRDYDAFNRARRAFFEGAQVDPIPASTGIGGSPVAERHGICLGLYAVQSRSKSTRTVMTSPTLNEAPEYGADFVRGMRMVEANKVALHVSGTASVDEAGRTAHVGDFDAQADRMLVNIAALLEGQGAGFDDVVSAVSYLADPANEPRLRARMRAVGFEGFPIACVEATVCRPDLLCETEALAILPRT